MYEMKNKKNNCHYRDCKAITDNLSRIFSLSCQTLIRHLSRIKKEINVMPILPEGKIQDIFKLNKRSGRSLEKIFKKIFRDDAFVFTLAAVLCFAFGGESWAECRTSEYQVTCRSGIDSAGTNDQGEYICGKDCTFTIAGDTIKVKANSANARIDEGIFSSWYYEGGKVVTTSGQEVNFNKIELDGDFAYIGSQAFSNSGATITSTSGVLNIKDAGRKIARENTTIEADIYISSNEACNNQTFQGAKIKGDLVFADGVTEIRASWFMGGARIDGNVVMPSSLTNLGYDNYITLLDTLNEGHKVSCGVNNCYKLFFEACYRDTREGYLPDCLNALNNLANNNRISGYPDGCSNLDRNFRCTKCKNENFRLNDGECDRLRYTPAEAAKVLHDDNTNSVTITFKK